MKIENAILRDILRKRPISNNKSNIEAILLSIGKKKTLNTTIIDPLNSMNDTIIMMTGNMMSQLPDRA